MHLRFITGWHTGTLLAPQTKRSFCSAVIAIDLPMLNTLTKTTKGFTKHRRKKPTVRANTSKLRHEVSWLIDKYIQSRLFAPFNRCKTKNKWKYSRNFNQRSHVTATTPNNEFSRCRHDVGTWEICIFSALYEIDLFRSSLALPLSRNLRPRPHVYGFVWKRKHIFPFSKKFASTRSASKSFSTVHTNTLKRPKTLESLTEYALLYIIIFHSSGPTMSLTKLAHQALVRPGLTRNRQDRAWRLLFKRFTVPVFATGNERSLIMFIHFLFGCVFGERIRRIREDEGESAKKTLRFQTNPYTCGWGPRYNKHKRYKQQWI